MKHFIHQRESILFAAICSGENFEQKKGVPYQAAQPISYGPKQKKLWIPGSQNRILQCNYSLTDLDIHEQVGDRRRSGK